MTTAARAGAVYFLAVFIVAFMVGAFRVIVVAPRLGEVMAVSLEAPVILIVSWVASRWATAKFAVSADRSARLLMGAVAFSLLLLAELALAVFAFGRPIETYLASFTTPQGLIGLASQILFALIPMLQVPKP